MSSVHTLFAAAVVALLIGPAIARFSRHSARLRAGIDGFAIVSVGGLALLLIAPGAISEGGFPAVLLLAAGVIVPALLHRVSQRAAGTITDGVLVAALAVHAVLESAVIATSPSDAPLGLAVIAHRLPVGLAVFSMARNRRAGWIGVGILVLATVVGFAGGHATAEALTETQLAWLHALVAGSLLHALTGHGVAHEHGHAHAAHAQEHAHAATDEGHAAAHAHRATPATVAGSIGAVIGGFVLVAATGHEHGADHALAGLRFFETLSTLALESAPALLAGYLLAGLVGVALTPRRAEWLSGGARVTQSLRGVAFGLPLPICSCGALPLYETLIRRGAPPTAAVAFLIATPEIGLDAVLLSIPLLGWDMTIARVVAALVISVAAALVVGRAIRPRAFPVSNDAKGMPVPMSERLRDGFHFGLVKLFDHTMPWILAGLFVAAMVEPLLGSAALQQVPAAVQVPLFALIGVPAYVCASGATPVAAIAIQQGISAGAALAFLIAGPATNITTFGILSRLHSKRVALLFGGVVTIAAVLAGWTVDALSLDLSGALQPHEHEPASPLKITALAALLALLMASLIRQGPRGMLAQIAQPFRPH